MNTYTDSVITENSEASAPIPTPVPGPQDWLGYFFGHDIDREHAELLALQYVPTMLMRQEAELFRKKWFDYRRLHPTVATYYFASCYSKAYGQAMKVMKDVSGQYMKGFKGMDFLESRERLSFWRLRQGVDKLGIRYDFFLRRAMDWYVAAGWLQPPRPSHILNNPEMIVEVMMAWEEECRARMQWPKDPTYKASAWCGSIDQVAWEQWCVDQLHKRQHPQYALHAALYTEHVLRIEAAIENFPERVIDSAQFECGLN